MMDELLVDGKKYVTNSSWRPAALNGVLQASMEPHVSEARWFCALTARHCHESPSTAQAAQLKALTTGRLTCW